MDAIGKIGVAMPEISDPLDFELLEGILCQAKKYGYDVIVITGVKSRFKNVMNDRHATMLENIYHLFEIAEFDGLIYDAERFYNDELIEKLEGILKNIPIPCIAVAQEDDDFISVYPKQQEAIRLITEHMIKEHNCRDMIFLAGFKGEYNSEERIKGFHQALSENGIEKSRIYYGDYWIDKTKIFADELADGSIKMPDAIICANDTMAAALCDYLAEHGIIVPDDVKVTGYDGDYRAYFQLPPLTTISEKGYELGITAFNSLYKAMTGVDLGETEFLQRIRHGTSCGCDMVEVLSKYKIVNIRTNNFLSRAIKYNFNRMQFMTADLIEKMNSAQTSDELIEFIDKSTSIIENWKSIDICLCEDYIFDFNNPNMYRREGFSDKMILLISKHNGIDEKSNYSFITKNLLPAFESPHKPSLYVLTSLHYKDQVLGYIATSYEKEMDIHIDEQYVYWCDSVANGFNALQEKQYNQYLRLQIEKTLTIDPVTGLYNRRGLAEQLPNFLNDDNTYSIILIYVGKKNSAIASPVLNIAIVVANALKATSDAKELMAVIEENIFIIIMETESEKLADKRLFDAEKEMYYMSECVSGLLFPEFYTVIESIYGNKMPEINRKIDDMILKVTRQLPGYNISGDFRQNLINLHREIYINPQNDWDIDSIQKKIGISKSHFNRLYQELFGVSCMDDVINARLEKAKYLLTHTDMRIKEIATQCGYKNESHFMRQFKAKVGITALQYRIYKNLSK